MKKFILATVSAVALLGVAACSDSGTDNSTTQSTNPPAAEEPMTPASPDATTPQATPPATDDSTTQSITPAPDAPAEPAPAPAPAQ
jgi:hypothetical protein